VAYPTAQRSFRRWAIRRLPWDRVQRVSPLLAYVKTLALIIFLPCIAGRGMAVPDHYHRAIRWAIAHILLAGAVFTMLCNDRMFPRRFLFPFEHEPSYHPTAFLELDAPMGRVIIWLIQSLLAWTIAFAAPPVLGVLLSLGCPRKHRVWKRLAAKWSLYAGVGMLLGAGLWYAFATLHRPSYPDCGWSFPGRGPALDPPLILLSGCYAIWWALGLSGIRYDRRLLPLRNVAVGGLVNFLAFYLLFMLAWLLLTHAAFPLGGLEHLL
jgi:hypothetical protein